MTAQIDGLDIRWWDMVETKTAQTPSEIAAFLKNKTVFITGGTGFVGALLIEKLLRSQPNIDRIYVLLRCKKGKSLQNRFDSLISKPLFEPLKRAQPTFHHKIQPIEGDILKPRLGIGPQDLERIQSECELVIHSAASVRFVEPLKSSVLSNIKPVMELLDIAHNMPKLLCFLHVSTAYVNIFNDEVEEKVYNSPFDGELLVKMCDTLDDATIDKMQTTILSGYPNTYTFTKTVAENVVKLRGAGLPIAIFRPSMIVATSKEPISGWIDNMYVPTGLIVGCALGLLKTLPLDIDDVVEVVPADLVANATIAILWDMMRKQARNEPMVYNCVSVARNRLTLRALHVKSLEMAEKMPTMKQMTLIAVLYTSSPTLYAIVAFLTQTVPAYIADFVLFVMGKKTFVIDKLGQIEALIKSSLSLFKARTKVHDENLVNLIQSMNETDRQLFNCNIEHLDWMEYVETYLKGVRVYMLKEDMSNIPMAQRRAKRINMISYLALFLLCVMLFLFVRMIFLLIF